MPKAHFKSTGSDDEDPHGYIIPAEAKAHIDALEKVMTMIEDEVEKQNTTELLETVLSDMKEILATLIPTMQLADTSIVTKILTYCYIDQTPWINFWRKYCRMKTYQECQKYLGRHKKEKKFLKMTRGWWLNFLGA